MVVKFYRIIRANKRGGGLVMWMGWELLFK
jgi:hypothetical protein